jgi:hypothetical protein
MSPENISFGLPIRPDNLNSLAVLIRSAIKSNPWLQFSDHDEI